MVSVCFSSSQMYSHPRNNEYNALIYSIEEFHRGSSDHSVLTLMWKSSHSPHLIAYSHFQSDIQFESRYKCKDQGKDLAHISVYLLSTPHSLTLNGKVILHKLLLHLQPAISISISAHKITAPYSQPQAQQ